MAAEVSKATVAAPTSPAFVAAYVGWAVVVFGAAAIAAHPHELSPYSFHVSYYLLVPTTVLLTAPWAGRARGLPSLMGRSAAAHALSTLLPSVLAGYMRVQSPGAGGHGGLFLILFFLLPTAAVAGAVVGLLAGLTAFAASRLGPR